MWKKVKEDCYSEKWVAEVVALYMWDKLMKDWYMCAWEKVMEDGFTLIV